MNTTSDALTIAISDGAEEWTATIADVRRSCADDADVLAALDRIAAGEREVTVDGFLGESFTYRRIDA